MLLLPKLLLVTSLSCLVVAMSWTEARAAFAIARVALTGDTAPDDHGVFTGFQFPSLEGGMVAFVANFNDGMEFGSGVFKGSFPGGLVLLVETGDPIPLSPEEFLGFCSTPSIEAGVVAFCADDTTQPFRLEGIYEAGGVGPLVRIVVDESTAQPGSLDNFSGFGAPSRDGGALAFAGVGSTGLRGVYRTGGGGVVTIADANTTVPGTSGTFLGSSLAEPSLDSGMVAFTGTENTLPMVARRGIYLDDGVSPGLSVVADSTDAAPGSGQTFQAFSSPSLSGGTVAFQAAAGGLPAVYVGDADLLEVVADTMTAIPGGDGLFTGFGGKVSHDLGQVAFLGFGDAGQEGVYVDRGDGPEKVVALGDLLDGRTVEGVDFRSEGLSGDKLTFRADFEDGAEGIYLVRLPESGALLGSIASLAAIGLWARLRGVRNILSRDRRV